MAAATSAAATDPTSFLLGDGKFVKDEFAVYGNGVARQGRDKVFAVDPGDLQRGATIGRGASSVVQLALHKPTQTVLALKIMNVYDKTKRHQLVRELTALYDADCDALVQFYGAFYHEGEIALCLEYMDGGSLSHVLTQVGPMPERTIACLAYQVLWGLAYMRHEKRLHRDLKPSNILLAADGRVKISDFGVSAELRSSIGVATSVTGTFAYLSPERIKHETYSFPGDIWGFGLCLLEASLATYPYPLDGAATYVELADLIVNSDVPPAPAGSTPEFVQFLALCLAKDPAARMPPDVLMGSPWFAAHGIKDFAGAVGGLREWIVAVRAKAGIASPAAAPVAPTPHTATVEGKQDDTGAQEVSGAGVDPALVSLYGVKGGDSIQVDTTE